MTQHAFQSEVSQLLHLVVHSLYSQREVFLRELLANAADACDKLRVTALTDASLAGGADLGVTIAIDKDAKTIAITDTGLGMTEAEAISHLGTIARSGTKAFVQQLADVRKKLSAARQRAGIPATKSTVESNTSPSESTAAASQPP